MINWLASGLIAGILIAFFGSAARSQEDVPDMAPARRFAVFVAVMTVLIDRWIADSLGGTLGKRAVGIRVVHEKTYDAPGLGSGFVRTLVSIISALPLGLGYLWAAWDTKGQTWHDKAAGTLVVRKSSMQGPAAAKLVVRKQS